jgi:fido (protein-threonine AMPylation protein)
MEPETWTDRINAWRAAPGAARARVRWERIRRNVAQSMAFEREAVPLRALEKWQAAQGGPDPARSNESLPNPSDRPSAVARQVLTLERRIEQARFDAHPLDDQLVRDLHRTICEPVAPHLAGWRRIAVAVGGHIAPDWPLVPTLMRDYGRDLAARIAAHGLAPTERLIETLAFAEGRLLAIHPFADYNGRVTRVFLRLLLRRLEFPPVRLAAGEDERGEYLAALGAADRSDWTALMGIWTRRIADAATTCEDIASPRNSAPSRPAPFGHEASLTPWSNCPR